MSFCGIQLEIEDGAPDVDIAYNRNKSLEDLFFDRLRLDGNPQSGSSGMDSEAKRRKTRGRREPGEVTVTTLKDFKDGKGSKEGENEMKM